METKPKVKGRKVSVATYAAALAASVGLAASCPASASTLGQVERYCASSWRNAGIDPQDWGDCTQEALSELLERVPAERLDSALEDRESQERRELKRAVWRTIQRWRRMPRFSSLAGDQLPDERSKADSQELAELVSAVLATTTPRQRQILMLWSEGWSIDEIAQRLEISPARASDEKYKAIQRIRRAADRSPLGAALTRGT